MMSVFDKVIGYETIKTELMQICDMIHNRAEYEKLGAKMPRGVLLHGNPGLGKSLMVKCLIEESGLKAYTLRRIKGGNGFVEEITNTFKFAKENAPAIVFLDDMDKFANEDNDHPDAEEYVAVQAGIDDVCEHDVFVIATVNQIYKLPDSLIRPGRFDRRIEVRRPTEKDAGEIIRHYLTDKKVSSDVDLNDVIKMITYRSCAELETIMNEAAVNAAFAKHDSISMADMTAAVLKIQYAASDDFSEISGDDLKKIALHEAGHLVVCEALQQGSVGLAALKTRERDEAGGFIRRCKKLKKTYDDVLIALAGKAAVELYYAEGAACGCEEDLDRAKDSIAGAIQQSCSCGFGVYHGDPYMEYSNDLRARSEAVVCSELERYMFKTRDILLKNRAFLEKTADELFEKKTLLYSDIQRIRESVTIV